MRWSLALALLAGVAQADRDDSAESSSSSLALSDASTITDPSSSLPTGSYMVYGTTITLADGDQLTSTITSNSTGSHTGNGTVHTSTHDSLTLLVGGGGTTTIGNSSMNATATVSATHSPTAVINTRPCNNYVEFCQRSYSNITEVGAHNSPFVQKRNAAANQDFTVTYQLDDGIRLRKSPPTRKKAKNTAAEANFIYSRASSP